MYFQHVRPEHLPNNSLHFGCPFPFRANEIIFVVRENSLYSVGFCEMQCVNNMVAEMETEHMLANGCL